MKQMETLNPISLPLDRSVLIEASAGTGKTYTMANLYLRLVLGIDCEPLQVEQILVVTFTVAATKELRDRIRTKLFKVARYFEHLRRKEKDPSYIPPPDLAEIEREFENDLFVQEVYQRVKDNLEHALLRLKLAERDMDLASIFTIDSFCQKMLFQFAFDSGVRFDVNLKVDESELLARLSEETWRELFYSASKEDAAWILTSLSNPSKALNAVRYLLSKELPPLTPEQEKWVDMDYRQQVVEHQQFFEKVKTYWRDNFEEIVRPIQEVFTQQNANPKIKILNAGRYTESKINNDALPKINSWVNSANTDFPKDELEYFRQSHLEKKTNKGKETPRSEHFVKIDSFFDEYTQNISNLKNDIKSKLTYRYLMHLRQKLADYKEHHSERSFSDMQMSFYNALVGKNGKVLAEKIRQQYKFAMIDESQDTDQIQYEIFKRIFIDEQENQGFIMIGDPKQSIYKFRGADIFSYLDASQKVSGTFTLSQNWRSLPNVVEFINKLFSFPDTAEASPFLYENIGFHPTAFKKTETRVVKKLSKQNEQKDQKKGEQKKEELQTKVVQEKSGNKLFRHNEQKYEVVSQPEINIYLLREAYERGHYQSDLAAQHCADQIQRQLYNIEQGDLFVLEEKEEFDLDGKVKIILVPRKLAPKDIAILVRSHDEARKVKQALSERDIQSVFLSEKESVYQTQEALDIAAILTACLNPYQQRAILAAIGSELWGLTADQIYKIKNNEEDWEKYVELFSYSRRIWQMQGILPMLHYLFLSEDIIKRINQSDNADRRVTNILHLAELLQEQMEVTENESALLRWFYQQIEQPTGSDEQILRLESEENLIKIITIHKSKGLEYPFVWLPFIGKKSKGFSGNGMAVYRREDNQIAWDLLGNDEEIKALQNKAEYAEDLRLLYVALTRAKYQLHMILPQKWSGNWNAMHYLLTNGLPDKGTETEVCLTKKGIDCHKVLLDSEPDTTKFSPLSAQAIEIPKVKMFEHKIKQTHQVTSFSALHSQHSYLLQKNETILPLATGDKAVDHDKTAQENVEVEQDDDELIEYTPYRFPHSTKVGNILHRFFELSDFTQPIDEEKVLSVCEQLGLSEEWVEPTISWFNAILATPFGEQPFSLNQVGPPKRLNEWQFYLRLSNEKALSKLNGLLKKYSPLAKNAPDLQLFQLEGFVRGFVDCFIEVDGKFYIIDYKSNYLGRLPQDYQLENIEKKMIQYRYDLQYILYTLAAHRYLKSRLGDNYHYAQNFGGVAYLFLRGMDGTPQSGVFFEKPSENLIEEMDALFA
ncbi:UvrD-helicase domain-containing protein [Otariodibacter sp.]|uniref:UvrD-helicase domain-containing protein n=1 Tax=Otariodibacter sp. TaxID=3030919 RepID=UPI00261E5D89|nr:UvrD-helicase domain-containing protein [Otariodibacter sp.]